MPSPLVLLKPGTDNPPFFITHGLGGSVMELCKVVEGIRTRHPVYGLQWRGLDGAETPDKSIEDMAQYFMTAIIDLQKRGPYLLAGLSMGGLPMLEVAHRLSERGERVALLAFLDTYPHPRYWPFECWLDFLTRRLQHHFSALRDLPLRDVLPRFLKLCRGFVGHLRSRRGTSSEPSSKADASSSIPSALVQLRESAIKACARYRPCSYRGKLTFLNADIVSSFPTNPTKVWENLVSQIEIHNIHCNHVGMITTHTEDVAAELSLCLEKALASKLQTGIGALGTEH